MTDRYRLVQPKLERQMTQSLKDYGQVSPIIVCELEGKTVLVDGFKRLHAARCLNGFTQLNARTLEVDEQAAKAALCNLNRIVGRPVELAEAWIIHVLVRDPLTTGFVKLEQETKLNYHESRSRKRSHPSLAESSIAAQHRSRAELDSLKRSSILAASPPSVFTTT